MKLQLPALILVGACAAASSAQAQFVWSGGSTASGHVSLPANWQPNIPPAPTGSGTENLTFGDISGTQTDIFVPGGLPVAVNNITFNGTSRPAYTFSGDGSTLLLNGALSAGAGANVTFGGGLILSLSSGEHVISVDAATQLFMAGNVGGDGSIIKTGVGTLTLSEATASHTGGTTVRNGTLAIAGGTLIQTEATIVVGRDSGDVATLALQQSGDASSKDAFIGQFAGSTGIANLTGEGVTWSTQNLYLGKGGTGTIALTAGGAMTVSASATLGFATGSVGTLLVDDSTFAVFGPLVVGDAGTAVLSASGAGTVQAVNLVLGHAATGQGLVTVTGAETLLRTDTSVVGNFGTGLLVLADGGILEVDDGVGTVTLGAGAGGTGILSIGATSTSAAASSGILKAGTVTSGSGTGILNLNTTATSGSRYYFTDTGASGGTPILVTGATQVLNTAGYNVLKSANTYTGGTLITGGTLALGASDSLPAGGAVTINAALAGSLAALDLNGFSQSVGPLALGGSTPTSASQIIIGAGGLLTLGGNVSFHAANNPPAATISGGTLALGGTRTFDVGFSTQPSADLVISSSIAGPGAGLIKTGAGTLHLNGASTFSGGTIINGGTLLVSSNALLSSGDVTVNATTAGTTASFQLDAGASQTIDTLTFGGTGATGTSTNTAELGTGTLTLGGNLFYNAANNPLGSTISGGTLALTGAHIFDVGNSTGAPASDLLISSVISGAGAGFTKMGAGRLTLTGANTYTGGTTIAEGILSIGNEGLTGSIAGNIVNDATLWFFRNDNLTYGGNISGTGVTHKWGAGTLTLTGSHTYTGSTHVNAGTLIIGAANTLPTSGTVSVASLGTLSVQNDQTLGQLTGSGSVLLASGKTLTVSPSGTNTFAGVLSGSGTFAVAGPGTTTLTGASTYTGGTLINEGRLTLGANNALPGGGNVALLSTVLVSELDVGATSQTIGSLTLGGAGAAAAARHRVFIASGGTLTLGGTVTFDAANNPFGNQINGPGTLHLGGNRTFAIGNSTQSGFDLAVSANIAGAGFSLLKTGAGSLGLTGTNTYTGATSILGGMISIVGDAGLGAAPGSATAAHLTLDGGTLQNSASFTLSANRGISLGATGGTFDTAASTTLAYGGILAGSGALIKVGPGTLTLTGANTYSGGTTISAGKIVAGHATALGSGALTLDGGTLGVSPGVALVTPINFGASGGTIGGSGTFGSTIHAGPNITLAPGDSPGTTTFTSTLTWAAGGSYNFEIVSAAGGVPGTSYDTIVIAGGGSAFNITATSAGKFNLNLLSLSSPTTPGNVGDFSAGNSYSWQIASSTNPITGFSPDAFAINTSGFTNPLGIGVFGVSINGSNTALFLNFSPIPEPSTYALMALGIGALLFTYRRRKS